MLEKQSDDSLCLGFTFVLVLRVSELDGRHAVGYGSGRVNCATIVHSKTRPMKSLCYTQ
jgi:hypothetical protein